jgi:integrase
VYVPGAKGRVRRRKTVERITRDQALSAWRAFRLECSGPAKQAPHTLRQFVESCYPVISAALAKSTVTTQRVIIDHHLVRYFGDTELTGITSIRVVDFKIDLRSRGLSAAYINDAVRLLKTLLRQAVERELLAEYPLKKRIPNEQELRLELELSADERAAFVAAFDDEHAFRGYLAGKRRMGPFCESAASRTPRRCGGGMRAESSAATRYFSRFRELREFFVVAVETGIRIKSDLRNLSWRSVDLPSGTIRIITRKTGREALVPISRFCREALLRCRARSRESEYVFVDESGKRYSPTRIRRAFLIAKRLAGITRRFRPHDLRHTFASRLATCGVSLQLIAKALGHTSTRMAERYARPSKEALRQVVDALDGDALPSQVERGVAVHFDPLRHGKAIGHTFEFVRMVRARRKGRAR